MQTQTRTKAASVPTDSPSVSFVDGVLQGCFKQRAEPATDMPILYDVPRLPEQSLDPATHASIKSRSGRDFSRVPIHTALPMMVQPKLTIGQPDDKYEREADRVADMVMSMPDPRVQRQVGPEEEEEEEPVQTKPLAAQITPLLQRQVEPEEEEEEERVQTRPLAAQITPLLQRRVEPEEEEEEKPIQAKLEGDAWLQRQGEELEEEEEEGFVQTESVSGLMPQMDSGLEAKVGSLRSGGQPLPYSVRSFFEPRFGHDFSKVRIHTDAQPEVSDDLCARAFTVGSKVVFAQNEFQPTATEGRRLIAHELTHVVQQSFGDRRGMPGQVIQRKDKVHTVQKGDTLYNIARKHGVMLEILANANGIAVNAIIGLGQKLKIPPPTKPGTSRPAFRHEIRRGDTLGKLAKKYGVGVKDIAAANNISPTTKLTMKELRIPGTKGSGSQKSPPPPAPKPAPASVSTAVLIPVGKYCSFYKIKKGDSVWSISRNTGVAFRYIMATNRLSKSYKIYSGKYLVVPHWRKRKDKATVRKELELLVAKAAGSKNVPEAILKGLVMKESTWDPCARSRTGPAGLMQFTRLTAGAVGLNTEIPNDERLDPSKAVEKGAEYLRQQFDRFKSAKNELERWRVALGAYNQGGGAVSKGIKGLSREKRSKYLWSDVVAKMDTKPGGEARNYVRQILGESGPAGGFAAQQYGYSPQPGSEKSE